MDDIVNAILQRVSGGWNRAWSNPMPNGSDEALMRLYGGRINQYATPAALRDVELGVQMAANDPNRPLTITLGNLRDQALRSRGLKYNQGYDEIPDRSATGAIMKQLINEAITGEYSGA